MNFTTEYFCEVNRQEIAFMIEQKVADSLQSYVIIALIAGFFFGALFVWLIMRGHYARKP